MNERVPVKSIFRSKTAIAAVLTALAGALGTFQPAVSGFLSDHAEAILLGIGFLNIALRMVTKGRVVLLSDD